MQQYNMLFDKISIKKTRYIDSLFTLVKNYPLQVIDKNILSSVHPIYNKTLEMLKFAYRIIKNREIFIRINKNL